MNAEQTVDRLLRESGATLLRKNKHEVWSLPNGNKFTRAVSPSDQRAVMNQLSDLRHALGMENPERGKAGERRERKPKHAKKQEWKPLPPRNTVMEDALRVSGVVEAQLRAEIERLKEPRCWWCRIKAWWTERNAQTQEEVA